MVRRLSAYPLAAFAGISAGLVVRAAELPGPISYLLGGFLLTACVALVLAWSERLAIGRWRLASHMRIDSIRGSRAAMRRLEELRSQYEIEAKAEAALAEAAVARYHVMAEMAEIEREYGQTAAEIARKAAELEMRRRTLDQRLHTEQQLIEIQRKHAEIQMHCKKGAVLRAGGDLRGAEAAYRHADQLGDGAAAYNLGLLLFERGDLEEAEAAWRRADERGSAAATSMLGDLLQQRGDSAGAESAWQRARAMRREGDDQAADALPSEELNGPAGHLKDSS